MSIGKNISKFRRTAGLTQEELGNMLGVTNQAVSKWESEASMPDIMLLPKLSEALKISLYDLYNNPNDHPDQNQIVNDFAKYTQNLVKNHLYRRLFFDKSALKQIAKFELFPDGKTNISSEQTIGVISYTEKGAAFISDNLSVISADLDIKKDSGIFENKEILSAMKKLCDNNVRKVLSYLFSKAFEIHPHDIADLADFFKNNNIHDYEFALKDISDSCDITEENTLSAIEKLVSLGTVEISRTNKNTTYVFSKTKAIELAVLFRVIEQTTKTVPAWGCGYIVGNSF